MSERNEWEALVTENNGPDPLAIFGEGAGLGTVVEELFSFAIRVAVLATMTWALAYDVLNTL